MTNNNIPLCVDLDFTLLKTDILFETFLLAVKKRFTLIFLIPFWLLKGKSFLKAKLSEYASPNPEILP